MKINVSTFLKFFLIIIPLLISSKAHSQLIRLSENVETFPAEMKTVMATGENSFAIALGETFAEQFQTKYTPEQQKILIATSLDMANAATKCRSIISIYACLISS
jgi:flagellar motor component MotA